ncbi:MAG TPA: ATP-binding protein [Rectinemataceae bacterium]|nr:ATP-binding protein [Rectinemataceae bacterium]
MPARGMTRRTAGILTFCILILFSSLTLIRIVAGYARPVSGILAWIALVVAAMIGLFVLYVKGWKASAWIVTAVYALFTGFFAPLGSVTQFLPVSLIMPAVVASIMTNWAGIVGTGTLVFGIIAVRRGYVGFIEQTVPVLNYLASVLGLLAAWLVQDKARHEADENAARFERLNVQLEGQVRSRTAELESANLELGDANGELSRTIAALNEAQAKLITSEKMGAIGRLAANLSHELNTPLGAIASTSETMRETLDRDLSRLLETGYALGPDAFRLGIEALRGLSASESVIDPRAFREDDAAIAAALTERGMADAKLLASELAALGDTRLALSLAPFASTEEGRDFIVSLGSLAFILASGRLIGMAAEQASRVVRTLQFYARGGTRLQPLAVDIRAEIEAALALYRIKMARRVELHTSFAEDSTAAAHPDEFRLILSNLIDNALEAMEYRGRLGIATEIDGLYLRISVSDSGPGIDQARAGRIFEPFFTTKSRGEGIGLGLDMVRKMTEACGGDVSFSSETGNTVFTVRLLRTNAM